MKFTGTRGGESTQTAEISFSEAIQSPMAAHGGIFSPTNLTPLPGDFLQQHLNSGYKTLAGALLRHVGIDIDDDVIDTALQRYDDFDDSSNPVPVVKVAGQIYVSELFHGPTRAFKDMALQPFGVLLSSLAKQQNEQYLILTATSGDTGPAALDTFRNQPNIRVACLYPDGGTSDVQRLQMVTESADNLRVIGINGNFDDAQAALKTLLASATFKDKLRERAISLSAANSVNFGRIIFQMLYQFHSYLELVRNKHITLGQSVVLHIPSGNFGNALGGYYARQLGLPVERIVIASNANNVLTEWIQTGCYDLSKRELIATTSPAMDILKSSNVERVLFDQFGAQRTAELMVQLDQSGKYLLTPEETARIQKIFDAEFCSDDEVLDLVSRYQQMGYLMCPHTATCFKACESERYHNSVNLVYATAEWTKFAPVMAEALTGKANEADLSALQLVADKAEVEITPVIASLFDKPVAQKTVVDKQDIEKAVLDFLSV